MPLGAEIQVVSAAQARRQEQLSLSTEEIYRIYGDRVARWAYRLGGTQLDVDEAVQDVFAVVQERLKEFRGTGLTSWLYRITENIVFNKLRQERWRRWLSKGPREASADLPAAFVPSALEQLTKAQADAAVYWVLDRMSERYRSVLVLFELEGMTGQEIARLKGVRVETLWVWLHRARAQFVQKLEELRARDRGVWKP